MKVETAEAMRSQSTNGVCLKKVRTRQRHVTDVTGMWHRWFACASSLEKLRGQNRAYRYIYDILYLAKQPKNDELPSLGLRKI
jgi:hypothetical protein